MIGEIKLLAFSDGPHPGHETCDGREVSRGFTELFALIGTTYGEGDGTETFNLPNINASPAGKFVIQMISLPLPVNSPGPIGSGKFITQFIPVC